MVEIRKCSFCGSDIEPGTGRMFVKRDGTIFYFDKNKCYKNMIQLKRVPRRTTWTQKAMEEKNARLKVEGKRTEKDKE